MEPEQPPSEELNPPATTTTDQQPQPQQNASHTTVVRSYECHFCKRGFTNAQALGGHMNIHRKDKTKLNKHPSSTTTTTTTSPKPLVESPSTTTAANPFSISHQGNWRFSDTPQDDKKPLPLFDHHDHTTVPRNIIHQPENPPLPEGDVDLELRLGHGTEPQPESSSENKTATTRKFF